MIAVVVPTIRPESMTQFVESWRDLFCKHKVRLITVWDGESPVVTDLDVYHDEMPHKAHVPFKLKDADLFCRHTDACRNLGFVAAAAMKADYILTLDDDCYPPEGKDPIQEHLDVLGKRVPINWMNTAHMGSEYLRGFPYGIREDAPVMVSHGVWTNVPDFDGETQLRLEATTGVPKSLPYYVGPIPRYVNFAICGMNLAVAKESLPWLYFAPMGADSGYPDLHRFADIFMGIRLLETCWDMKWSVYTGASVIHHSRASIASKNFEQEKLGREWMEYMTPFVKRETCGEPMASYVKSWYEKSFRFRDLIQGLQK